MIGCICRLQVDSSITGGLACVTGEGIWGRDRARAGKGEGNACKQAVLFAIPPTKFVCKNNAKR